MSAHPGHIVFEDTDRGTSNTRSADTVPEGVAWATVDGEQCPVVRVVATTRGRKRTLRSYGIDGALLTSTVQVRR